VSNYLEIAGFEDISHEDVQMSDVVEYLNDILILYGPPCDWCAHFDYACSKKFRPRNYSLKFGPFESWYLRKHCKSFEGKEEEDKSKEVIEKRIRRALDCNAQTYG